MTVVSHGQAEGDGKGYVVSEGRLGRNGLVFDGKQPTSRVLNDDKITLPWVPQGHAK